MTLPPLYARSVGAGPALVLVHGSAANADGWTHQIRGLKDRYRITVLDRRGTARSPLPDGATTWSVEQHAEDLARLLEARVETPAVVCGSSFGGACVMELSKARPDLLRGVVLCEPPLPPVETGPAVVEAFAADFERRYEAEGGAAAARLFLETVLGPEDFARLPPTWLERAEAQAAQIRLDVRALGAYTPNYSALAEVRVPALALGGTRSQPYFQSTLERLRVSYPTSARLTLQEAGHMMHLDQPEAFNRTLAAFEARFLGPAPEAR